MCFFKSGRLLISPAFLYCFFLIGLCGINSAFCIADTTDTRLWVGDASVQYKNLSLTHMRVTDTVSFDVRANFFTLKTSLTVSNNKTYLSFNYDGSVSNNTETYATSSSNGQDEYSAFSRRDANITVGHNLSKTLSLFGGYLFGETEYDFQIMNSLGDTLRIGSEQIREFGLFVGLNYTKKLSAGSKLNTNIAYANLRGELESTVNDSSKQAIITGNTDGLSLGIKYSVLVSKNLLLYIGFNRVRYQFTPITLAFRTTEEFYILSFGVSTFSFSP